MASLVLVVAMVLSLAQLSAGSRRLMELYIPPPSDQLTDQHGGVLSGDIRVTTLWYGSFSSAQKSIVYDFLLSLTTAPSAATASVAQWWGTIDQLYLSSAATNAAASVTRVLLDARVQVSDEFYSQGKSLTLAQIEQLAARAGAKKGGIVLVFTDQDVAVEGFCSSWCGKHGSAAPGAEAGSTYIWVGNAVKQCPRQCAWPFGQPLYGPQGAPLVAPNGNAGMDGLVMVLATMVAGTVTKPYRDGFYQGSKDAPLEACPACPGVYGSGTSTLVGAATPRDVTVVATMDASCRTPSPQTTSAKRHLKHFTKRITKARQPPLLKLSGVDTAHARRTPPALSKRSRWIAAQSISHIQTSKRGVT